MNIHDFVLASVREIFATGPILRIEVEDRNGELLGELPSSEIGGVGVTEESVARSIVDVIQRWVSPPFACAVYFFREDASEPLRLLVEMTFEEWQRGAEVRFRRDVRKYIERADKRAEECVDEGEAEARHQQIVDRLEGLTNMISDELELSASLRTLRDRFHEERSYKKADARVQAILASDHSSSTSEFLAKLGPILERFVAVAAAKVEVGEASEADKELIALIWEYRGLGSP